MNNQNTILFAIGFTIGIAFTTAIGYINPKYPTIEDLNKAQISACYDGILYHLALEFGETKTAAEWCNYE